MKTFTKKFTTFITVMLLVIAGIAYAANKILVSRGTQLLFADTAQSEQVALTLSALAAGTGCTTACTRCSTRYQKTGDNAKSQWWSMRPHFQLTGTNVVDEPVEFYVASSDGTNNAGEISSTDGTINVNVRKALTLAGVARVYQTSSNTNMSYVFDQIYIPHEYYSICVSNQTTLPFKTDTGVHGVVMQPMDIEVQ